MAKRTSTSSIEEVNSSIDSVATDESIEDRRDDATVESDENRAPTSRRATVECINGENKIEKRGSTSRRQTRLPAKLRDPAFMLNKSMDSLEVEMRDSKL